MRCSFTLLLALLALPLSAQTYYPPRGDWAAVAPQSLGVNSAKLAVAVDYAIASENPASKDQAIVQATTFGAREPYDQIIGPMGVRAAANGLIIYQGKLIARWGDVDSVDMTHSIAKTFLTTVTGLAWQQGLIRDLNDKVAPYMPHGTALYDGEHNSQIRWQHLLRQTSDWQGTLWGKPDWADRPEGKTPADWPNRPLRTPGSHYKYNDVRINLLALSTLYVWRKPLPEVLNQKIMQQADATVLVSQQPRETSRALLYFGGNAGDVSVALPEFAAAFPGHAIYLMHYRGYGGSSGKPSEQALVADALALYDQLQSKHSDITVLGRSLGSGVAVQLAAQRKVAQLVLITPFDNLSELARRQFPLFPVKWLLKDTYNCVAYAPAINSPTLILLAEQDEIIGRAHSEALYRAFAPGMAALKSYAGNHNSYLPASQLAAWLAAATL